MRHNGGNTLKSQDHHEGLRALPLKAMECDYFQWIRKRILGAKWRDLKEKQLKLAQAALHCSNEDPWTQRMESWNRENMESPDWCYDNLSNFKRDCQNAIGKLLAPVLFTPPFLPTQRGK